VFEGLTSHDKNSNSKVAISEEGMRYFESRDNLIERFNKVYEDDTRRRGMTINLDAVFRVKIAQSKSVIQTELQHRLAKSINNYAKNEKNDYHYGELDKQKTGINNKFSKLKIFHDHLRNSYTARLETFD
jgi:bisphosphoglycerate-dependent phosphoglycerate mutase